MRRVHHVPCSLDVYFVVDALGYVELAESRREMEDELHALHARGDGRGVRHGSDVNVRAHRPERVTRQARLVVERHDLMSGAEQSADERSAREPRSPSDQNFHTPSSPQCTLDCGRLMPTPSRRDLLSGVSVVS